MITRARFQNFKALRDVEVTFDSRLTVLVGPNGSGKTSVLQGIQFLTQLAQEGNSDPEYQFQSLPEYFSITTTLDRFVLQAEGERSPENGKYGISVTVDETGTVQFSLTVLFDGQPHERPMATARWAEGRFDAIKYRERPRPTFSQRRFDSSAIIRFSAARLATPTVVRTYPPQLAKDGSGLAATLNHIKNKYPKRFQEIEESFLRVIQNSKRIRFDQEPVPDAGGIFGQSLLIDFDGADGVKARHLSSGTLFALGLLTIVLGPDSPNVILLDDLDHGLHPKAQMELVDVFRGLIQQNPELQIVATSHSPYILNQLEWNEVLVTSRGDDGSAICKPLTDHPDFERWKESMSPGEFWGTFYEDWLTKTRSPQPVP
jgi:predicted ATPase